MFCPSVEKLNINFLELSRKCFVIVRDEYVKWLEVFRLPIMHYFFTISNLLLASFGPPNLKFQITDYY